MSAKKIFIPCLFFLSPLTLAESALLQQYSACMTQSGSSTSDARYCIHEEIRRQEQRLNTALQKALESLSPARKRALQTAQRAWIKYKKAHCSFYLDIHGGQQAVLNTNICVMNMTATRTQELTALIVD